MAYSAWSNPGPDVYELSLGSKVSVSLHRESSKRWVLESSLFNGPLIIEAEDVADAQYEAASVLRSRLYDMSRGLELSHPYRERSSRSS